MTEIKSITLYFPNSEQGEIVYYEVGRPQKKDGKPVTKIMLNSYATEPYCEHQFYQIFTADGLVVDMHQFGAVEYFTKEPSK